MTTKARLPLVVQAIGDTLWTVTEPTLAMIVDLVSRHNAGDDFTARELRDRIGTSPQANRPAYALELEARGGGRRTTRNGGGAIAVLSLYGVMIPRATVVSQMSGGTSVEQFTADFKAAASDPAIGSILIDAHSPGGAADLVPELAAAIFEARSSKPVVAIANTLAASGAYWAASQANEVYVTPSGSLGSIGVYTVHEDHSEELIAAGIKTTLIKAGRFKTEGNPFEPLSDAAAAAFQRRVDNLYDDFTADVGRGRSASAQDVADGYGEGRVLDARDAVEANLADGIATFDQVVGRLARGEVGTSAKLTAADAALERRAYGSALAAEVEAEAAAERELAAAAGEPQAAPTSPSAVDPTANPTHDPERTQALLSRRAVREAFNPTGGTT